MALLSSLLHGHPRLLKLPPYLSTLCILIGIIWLLLIPLNQYSRNTYISENALLPGQVHTYFAGSDQNVFRGFKREVDRLVDREIKEVNDKLEHIFTASGLKVARQHYEYLFSGTRHSGENIYAILHAPRGDATEAIVLVGPWRNMEGELNGSGVALTLTLARYFKRWSLWSKDIIFLVTPDSRAGPQAWVDAYHDAHSSSNVASLPLKSGALQGAVVIDYPFDHHFESIHIVYDGINGELPNLDLFNTVVSIASGQMGIPVSLQGMWKHRDTYQDRLQTMLRGMLRQALGHASGPHSYFIPYHIDAVTLQPFGNGWQNEMAMGRVIESTFRSLNNLLEHLHQSFFFYLLMQANRFVSIGTYLPSAMLVAVNFTITAIILWVRSGKLQAQSYSERLDKSQPQSIDKRETSGTISPSQTLVVEERQLFLPLGIVTIAHFFGMLPLYIFNHCTEVTLHTAFVAFTFINSALPWVASFFIIRSSRPTIQQYRLMKSFSLLLFGMFLSSLATLNFSLSFLIGLLAAPLSYIRPAPGRVLPIVFWFVGNILAPTTVLSAGSYYWNIPVSEILKEAAFGWNVWGMNTQVVVWCVWWPAWLIGMIVTLGQSQDAVSAAKS